ncbi:MAG: hypothetical protein ACREQP_00135 [Candidatus Binatia bacterium]
MDFSLVSEPEKIIGVVRHRLALHALWQAVLFFLPPLLAFYYMIFFLHRFEWLASDAVLVAGASLLVVASVSVVARFRSLAPSERVVARLIDDKAAGEDRFVTLATIEPMASPPVLLSRLKREAAALLARIEFKRDFPFRVSRSFLNSCIASLIAIVLFHLSMELAPLLHPNSRDGDDLALVGEELARFPGLEKLAERVKAAATQIQDPAISDEEKRSAIEELRRQISQQLAGSERASGRREELLSQAKNQLSGLEDGLGSGQGRRKGTGGQSSDQHEGKGQGTGEGDAAEKQSGKGPHTPPGAAEKTISETTKPTGQQHEKPARELGGTERAQGDDTGSGSGRGPNENLESKTGKGPQDGKNPETTPQPSLRPGDRGQALKNSRFVTVQLPEEQAASTTAGGTSDGKRAASGSRPPVGNLPLARPEQPNAAMEKQMLPLEYRGMIR